MSGDFFFGVFLFLLLRWLALLFNLLAFPRLRPRPTPPKPTASLLVPARNEAENLKRTLPALLRQGALEVLVLDDLSEDGTAQAALEAAGNHPAFRLLRGGAPPPGGGLVAAQMDHRVAMAFLMLGQATRQPVRIDDGSFIDTSFPGYVDLINGLSGSIAKS